MNEPTNERINARVEEVKANVHFIVIPIITVNIVHIQWSIGNANAHANAVIISS